MDAHFGFGRRGSLKTWGIKSSQVMSKKEKGEDLPPSKSFGAEYMYDLYRAQHLKGRLLTIIEAIGLNERQEKAVKDVVNDALAEFYTSVHYVPSELADQVRAYKGNVPPRQI